MGEPRTATLLLVLDLVGTFVFALSGATAGVRNRLDLFGVLVLSFAAGNAGGIARDLLIGAAPPAAISDWRYLAVSLLAGIVTFWRPSIIDRLSNPVLLFDAAGLGALRGCRRSKGARLRAPPGDGSGPRNADRDRRRHDPRCAPDRGSHRIARRSLRRRRPGRRRRGRDRRSLAAPGDRGDDRRRGPLLRAPVHGYSPRLASSDRRRTGHRPRLRRTTGRITAQRGSEMSTLVLVCGNVFDGLSDALTGPAEILVEGNRIAKIERSVGRPPGARVIDLSERTVSPGFIDTHVHLTMDAADLALQTLQSSAAKALEGTEPRPRIHELRVYDAARSRQRRSGMADDRSAQRAQFRPCGGTAALRRRAYHQRERRPRRSPRLLCLALDVAGFCDCRRSREHQSAGAARAHLRQRLDQDGEHRRLFQRRRRSGAGDVVRRRDGSADIDRPSARHACGRSHGRRRRMQAGHPLLARAASNMPI